MMGRTAADVYCARNDALRRFRSRNYFSMVDARVIVGRLQVTHADGGAPSVMIGERFWREKQASISTAGLTLRLNNTDVSATGVLPDSYTGPAGIYSPDIWLPLEDLALFGTAATLQARDALVVFSRPRVARDDNGSGAGTA